jgi:hypothetical protein
LKAVNPEIADHREVIGIDHLRDAEGSHGNPGRAQDHVKTQPWSAAGEGGTAGRTRLFEPGPEKGLQFSVSSEGIEVTREKHRFAPPPGDISQFKNLAASCSRSYREMNQEKYKVVESGLYDKVFDPSSQPVNTGPR